MTVLFGPTPPSVGLPLQARDVLAPGHLGLRPRGPASGPVKELHDRFLTGDAAADQPPLVQGPQEVVAQSGGDVAAGHQLVDLVLCHRAVPIVTGLVDAVGKGLG